MIGRLTHGKFNNRYSFVKDSKYLNLAYLTPKQVYKDKWNLKREYGWKT